MKLADERERGNIGDDTDIVNEGEYMGYAEATLGGWTVEFQRARESNDVFHRRPERVTIKGPFMDDEKPDGKHREMEVTDVVWRKVTEAIETWDYIEAAEQEVFRL